ncbi:hypothetical protein J6590_050296 [Homalodisca vitripennis]|nr:hypothetical protein J6590_050296 [Homalodisca vitripennis]
MMIEAEKHPRLLIDYLDVKRSLDAQWTDVAARMRGPARSPSSAVSQFYLLYE